MKDTPIVSVATGFTSENGRNYILVFHEAVFSFTKHMSSIVHLKLEIRDQVDKLGSAADVETNGCRFVNTLLVNID